MVTIHVNGWNVVNQVYKAADVDQSKLTATKHRHGISTLNVGLSVKETERPMFYEDLRHTAQMNVKVYQTPLAQEVRLNGSHLLAMDTGISVQGDSLSRFSNIFSVVVNILTIL